MKFLLFVLLLAVLPLQAAVEEPARVIVRFKSNAASVKAKPMAQNASRLEARDLAQLRGNGLGLRNGRALSARRSLDNRTHVFTATGISSAALASRLAQDSEVEMVVVDKRRRHSLLPNDPLFGGANSDPPVLLGRFPDSGGVLQDTYSRNLDQWHLKLPSSIPGQVVSSINAPAAWDITTGAAAIVVAVLDTGVRKDHPDLWGQFVGGYDMITDDATSGDLSSGRDSDASDTGDWVSQADIDSGALGSGCTAADIGNSSWHGTRVSGLIAAASNNGLGIAGVAWSSKILPVRVLGKCGGYDSDIQAGMLWAAGITVPGLPANPNPARVLNMSLGSSDSCTGSGSGTYPGTINQVLAKGAIIVAAAGNSTGQAVGLPGNCPGVIAVTGLRHVGSKVGFSSVGPEVTISAPGGNCINLASGYACLYTMISTTNSGKTTPVLDDNAYTTNTVSVGTSFSTPLVSGAVALMLSVRPALTPAEVMSMLKKTARPFVTSGASADTKQCVAPKSNVDQLECYCTTSTCGAGMLDASAAVLAAQVANATTPQSISFTQPPSQILSAGTLTLVASSSSGLAVSFSSSTPTVCTVSGSLVTLVTTGNCTVTANQAGNAIFMPATAVSHSFTISAAAALTAQTITFELIAAQTFGITPANLSASASSGLAVTLASTTSSVCTVSGNSLTLLAAGNCSVTASQSGNSSYAAAPSVTRSFSVLQGTQTISFAALSDQVLGGGVIAISASSSAGLAVSLASTTPTVCALSGSNLSLLAAGTCTLTANQAGNANYSSAISVTRSFAVAPTPQTITFAAIADRQLGSAALSLSATSSASLAISFASSTTAVCSVNGAALTLLAVGNCTITASQDGNASIAAATPVSRTFAVTAAPSSGSGGGGGGAFSGFWLALLALASFTLQRRPNRASASR
jgi:serine protease